MQPNDQGPRIANGNFLSLQFASDRITVGMYVLEAMLAEPAYLQFRLLGADRSEMDMKILFMCVANSARSQLAEGLAKSMLGAKAQIESAGSMPRTVNHFAVRVLSEIGIDISKHHSKSVENLSAEFLDEVDYVITLCAEEVCPILPSKTATKLHWPFPDPVGETDLDEESLERFRKTRDAIKMRIERFIKEIV